MNWVDESGFTVAELTITLVLGLGAVVMLTGGYMTVSRLNANATALVTANQLAVKYLQKYQGKNFSDLAVIAVPDPGLGVDPTPVEDFSAQLPANLASPRTGKVLVVRQTATLVKLRVRVDYGDRSLDYVSLVQSGGLGR